MFQNVLFVRLSEREFFMYVPLSLLLVREVGGRAVPICRVRAPGLINRVRNAAVRERLAEAQQATDPLTRRRAQMEAELIQSTTKEEKS
jgi:hypothetical protein